MIKPNATHRRRRALSTIEVLVASLILSLSVVAMVSTWYVSLGMTLNTEDQGIGANLARITMESVKSTGFYNTAEAPIGSPTVHYYDGTCTNSDNNTTEARYKVSTTVVSSATQTNVTPTAPTDSAVRTVTITVSLASNGATICSSTSYLVRAGI